MQYFRACSSPWLAGLVVGFLLMSGSSVLGFGLLPNLTLTAPWTGAVVSGLVPVSALADGPGLASLQFEVSGQPIGSLITQGSCATNWDSRTVPDGTHTITAVGRDSIGTPVWALPVVVSVRNASNADVVAPSVSITSPAPGASVSGTVSLTASASDANGVSAVWFTLDGTPVGDEDRSAPYAISLNTTQLTEGAHILQALARDAAGNVGASAAVWVAVKNQVADAIAPSVAVTGPANGSTISGAVTLSANASDNVRVASVQFTVDGNNVGAPATTSPYTVSWSSTGVSNGNHVIRAVATDTSGNRTTSSPITVSVNNVSTDTTRPTISFQSPASQSTVSGIVTVRVTASDNVGVVGVRFTVDGASLGPEVTAAPYQVAWNSHAVPNGSHVLRAEARDAAGNTRSASRTIVVSNRTNNSVADATPPAIAFVTPATGTDAVGSVNIVATASDNVGVVGVQFQLDGINLGPEQTTAPYQMWWNSGLVANGSKTLTAIARDAAGNTSTAIARIRVRNPGSGVRGDLDNDGFADLVFRHSSGQLYTWFMRWAQLSGQSPLTPGQAGPMWRLVGLADLDGDRRSDIVWQHVSTGQIYSWLMDGATLIGERFLSEAQTTWRVAAVGDLNGDGKADLIWHHPDTGDLAVTLLDGFTTISHMPLNPGRLDTNWRLAGVADMNRDGREDLLWQNMTTGHLVYWLMDANNAVGSGLLSPGVTGTDWHIKALADFDLDGFPDIVWQHASTNHLYVWFMAGTTLKSDRFLTPAFVGPGWEIVGGR